jgi:hypothetical protein
MPEPRHTEREFAGLGLQLAIVVPGPSIGAAILRDPDKTYWHDICARLA